MTNDSAAKKQIRAYAQEHDVPYTQARRAILGEARDLLDALDEGLRRVLTIHYEPFQDLSLPYPHEINNHGDVLGQEFWRGDPFRLVGFTPEPAAGSITVPQHAFLQNPEKAVGLYPVFAEFGRDTWATWTKRKVAQVTLTNRPVPAPVRARAVSRVEGREAPELVLNLADYLLALPDEAVESARAGWWEITGDTADRLLTCAGHRSVIEGVYSDFEDWAENNTEDNDDEGGDQAEFLLKVDPFAAEMALADHRHSAALAPVGCSASAADGRTVEFTVGVETLHVLGLHLLSGAWTRAHIPPVSQEHADTLVQALRDEGALPATLDQVLVREIRLLDDAHFLWGFVPHLWRTAETLTGQIDSEVARRWAQMCETTAAPEWAPVPLVLKGFRPDGSARWSTHRTAEHLADALAVRAYLDAAGKTLKADAAQMVKEFTEIRHQVIGELVTRPDTENS